MRTLYTPVTVYTKPGCWPCIRVKRKLEDAGIAFEVVDITLGCYEEAFIYVTETLGAKSVPVIVTDDLDPIIGYQPDKLAELIEYYTQGI